MNCIVTKILENVNLDDPILDKPVQDVLREWWAKRTSNSNAMVERLYPYFESITVKDLPIGFNNNLYMFCKKKDTMMMRIFIDQALNPIILPYQQALEGLEHYANAYCYNDLMLISEVVKALREAGENVNATSNNNDDNVDGGSVDQDCSEGETTASEVLHGSA